MQIDGKRTVHAKNVGFFAKKEKKFFLKKSRGSCKRKASGNTGSVAAVIASQRVLAAK